MRDVILVTDVVHLQGPQGPKGDDGRSFLRTAAQDLSGHRAVSPTATGSVEYADPTDSLPHRAVWLTTHAVLSGAEVTVVGVGTVVESSWSWAPGQPVWLHPNGVLSQSLPSGVAHLVRVGTAVSPTSIYVDSQSPIALAP